MSYSLRTADTVPAWRRAMDQRMPWLLAGAALAVMLALVWPRPWAKTASDAASIKRVQPAAASTMTPAPEGGDAGAMRSAPGLPADLPPLPAVRLPLAQQLPALIARAEAGEPKAACRLLLATQRCLEEARRQAHIARVRSRLQNSPTPLPLEPLVINSVARSDLQSEFAAPLCGGVDIQSLPPTERYFERALPRFSPRQRLLLALMRGGGEIARFPRAPAAPGASSPDYRTPSWQARHAAAFMAEGFQARDPLALEAYILLHDPTGALAWGQVQARLPNPRSFLRYALLYQRLYGNAALGEDGGRVVELSLVAVTPADLLAIEAWVDAEAARWQGAVAGERAPLPPTFQATGEPLERCDE